MTAVNCEGNQVTRPFNSLNLLRSEYTVTDRLNLAADELERQGSTKLAEYARSLVERVQPYIYLEAPRSHMPSLYRCLSHPEATILSRMEWAIQKGEDTARSRFGRVTEETQALLAEVKATVESDPSHKDKPVSSAADAVVQAINWVHIHHGLDTSSDAEETAELDRLVCSFVLGEVAGFYLGMKALSTLQTKPEALGVEPANVAMVVSRLTTDPDYRREFVAQMADQVPEEPPFGDDDDDPSDFRMVLMNR